MCRDTHRKGVVYLVGAGPGDPGLLTLAGQAALAGAEVVIYDHLANPRLLEHAPSSAERIYVGKQAAAHTLDQGQINRLMIDRAVAGAVVVRLKGGDPFVFGRGGEEAMALAEAGIRFEVIPGVTAGIAAAACAGIPVTHRGLAGAVALVAGQGAQERDAAPTDYRCLGRFDGTVVFYMAVANLKTICRELLEGGMPPDTPAAVIHWGTTPAQQTLVATVGDIAAKTAQAGIRPPAVLVVGRVVSLRDKIAWFERRPLANCRIVVTRAPGAGGQLAWELNRLGAEVIEYPVIRFEPPADRRPLDEAIAALGQFDWVVFTSANAVEWFFAALESLGLDARAFGGAKVCTIGPATTARLREFGLRSDAQPRQYLTSAIIETLASKGDLSGLKVLCPRSDVAPADLPDALAARGAVVRQVVAYRTLPAGGETDTLLELLRDDQIGWITFTSASIVTNFFAAVGAESLRGKKARLASIGPRTSEAIRRLGFQPAAEAREHTIPGLLAAIMEYQTAQGSM
jgi:uroporphyrinogen III methyltransferase/synthase